MANYASQLVKQLEKQINEQQKKEKEMRKGIVKIPSPSNNLKVADNSTAKSVNTSTGQTSGSISNGENLSDRGYSSTVNDFKSGNSSKGFSLTARMGSDLADYNALTIGDSYKGGNRSGLRKYKPSAKAKAEELKAKYGIDDKQLEEANIAYTKSKIESSAKKGRENAERFSENNHLVSELGRAVMRPFSNLEGYGNLISAKTKGKIGTQDYTMGNYTDALASGTDKAIENSNMSDTGKFVANTAVGLGRSAGDMAVNFALSRATGLPMGTFSAGNAANDYLRRATERGSDLDKAAKVAGANAAVDFALSNWGMDELLNVSKAGKNLGTTVAKSAGIEGLEEGVQNIAEQANDAFMNYDKSQYKEIRDRYLANGDSETVATLKTLRDLGIEDLQAAGAGALFGGLMPVGKAAVSKANANIPRVYLPQNKITNANVNTDTNVEAKPEVITEPTVNSEANVQEEVTQPVVNNQTNTNANSEVQPTTNSTMPVETQEKLRNLLQELKTSVDNNASHQKIGTVKRKIRTAIDISGLDASQAEAITKAVNGVTFKEGDSPITKPPYTVDEAFNAITGMFSAQGNVNTDVNAQTDVQTDAATNNQNIDNRSERANELRQIISRTEDALNNATTAEEREFYSTALEDNYRELNTIETSLAETERQNSELNNVVNNTDTASLTKDIISATNGYENLDPTDIETRLKNGDDIDDVKEILAEIADPENEMPKKMQAQASKVLADIEAYEGADSMNEDIGIDNSPVVAERTSLPITDDIEPSSPELRYSDVTKNTGVNSGVVDADELDTADMRAVSEYLPTNNQESLKKAKDRASEDFEGWEERYASGKEEITNDVDVDTSMVILSKLKADMNAAVNNGDTELADTYRIRRNRLLEQLRKAGTKGGQMIQAFAKWNFTSDGAVLNAQKMLTDKAQKYLKSNAKEKQVRALSGKLLKALDNLVDDGTIKNNGNKDSLDVIKKKVQNTLEAEMISVVDNSDGTNPSKHEFTQDDVNFLANLINQGADADELTNYLATKFATGKFDVSDAAVSKVNELFDRAEQYGVNSKERVELEVEAWKVLADDLDQDATFWEKFDAWRYLAMLGNPKTHVRNMIGNAMFRQVTGFSNTLAASIEEWYSKTEKGKGMRRTKAVLDPRSASDNALIDMSLNDIEDNSFRQLAGDKFNDPKQGINSQKRIFKLKNVEGARVVNNSALGTEDYSAKRKKYATSMAGFLKANGLDASAFEAENDIKRLSQDVRTYNEKIDEKKAYATNLENKAKKLPLTNLEQHSLDKAKNDIQTLKAEQKAVMNELNEASRVNKIVEEAREYAIKSAEYSTFNQNNKIANKLNGIISDLKRNPYGKPFAMLIEGLIPFKRTPMNIVKSIYDYSPLGFVSAAVNAKTSKSEFRTAETIDMISKASTGTLLAAVGFALQKLGIININNDDQQYTNPAEGKQQYSVIINGKSYTIDFAVPAVAPLLMGASLSNYNNDNDTFSSEEFMDALMDKDFGRVLNQMSLIPKPVTNAFGSLASPVLDTTMMSGINNIISAATNYNDSENDALSTLARNMLGSYFSQAVPTTMGQLSRTLDPTRRSTYSDETGGAAATDRSLMKMLNKTPLSRLNEPYIDSSGREQSNSPFNNIFANAAYQFLSPSYIQNVAPTDVEKQSDALYETTRDSNALLNSETSPKIKGSKLDKTDMTTWSKDYGQIRSDMRSELFASDYFKNLSPADKVEAIKDIDKAARNIANYNLAQGDNKLSDAQIEYASKTTDASSWESSGKDAKAFVDLYTKHQSLKQGAADSGVVSSNGQVNTDRYEKLETVTDGNKDVIAGLNECYNDSGKLDTAKSLEYFEKNNIPDSEAGRYMYELNGGAEGGKKMQAAYKAFDYVGVKEYYNIRNYCGSDVTKQKVIDYLNSKGIKYNDKNTSAEYNKWMKDVFGFDPTTDGEGRKLK